MFLTGLPLLLLIAACEVTPPPPPALVVGGDTIALPAGARVHDIDVRVDDAAEFDPDRLHARAGDVLRFTMGDGRGHALVFDSWTLTDSAAAFLDASGQRRGPPLLATGAAWIVDLAGAPVGEYRVVCTVHQGELRVDLTGR